MGGPKEKRPSTVSKFQLLFPFLSTAPATGELVSTRQQPTDSTATPLVEPPTITPLSDGLRKEVLARSTAVKEKIDETAEGYRPPAKNKGEDIPL